MVSLSLLLLVTEGMHSGRFRGYFGVFAFEAAYILVSFAISQDKQVCSQGSHFEKRQPVGVVSCFLRKSNVEIVRGE
jgi:hypothetical protein